MLCDTCLTLIDKTKIPEDLLYSPHFCTWTCALKSGRDLTLNGQALASPAYIEFDDREKVIKYETTSSRVRELDEDLRR